MRLADVCRVVMGQAPPGDSYNVSENGVPLLAGASDFGSTIPHAARYTTKPTRLSEPGDILLCVRATIGERNWSDRAYCLGRGVAGLKPQLEELDKSYLWHWLAFSRATLERRARGSTFKQVTREAVESMVIPLPPLAEQRRFAHVLDGAERMRQRLGEGQQLFDELLRSEFLELFGDPVRNDRAWEIVRLGDRLTFLTSGSRGWAKYYSDSGRPFVRIQNVGRNELLLDDLAHVVPPAGAETERTRVKEGDVLLSITADLGRTAVATSALADAHISQHLAILRVRDLDSTYLASFLSSAGGARQFRRLNRQAVKAGLNFDDIRSLLIPIPPANLQERFRMLYGRCLSIETKARERLHSADALLQSLMRRVFEGVSKRM